MRFAIVINPECYLLTYACLKRSKSKFAFSSVDMQVVINKFQCNSLSRPNLKNLYTKFVQLTRAELINSQRPRRHAVVRVAIKPHSKFCKVKCVCFVALRLFFLKSPSSYGKFLRYFGRFYQYFSLVHWQISEFTSVKNHLSISILQKLPYALSCCEKSRSKRRSTFDFPSR